MARLVTLYSLQWGDLSLEDVCIKAKEFGYDGLELGLPDHLDVNQTDPAYFKGIKDLMAKYDLQLKTISSHLIGQAVCDCIDERHKSILPDHIWGDGDPEGVRQRAAQELIQTAKAAKALGVKTVVGFTGSSIWHLLYAFPPFPQSTIDDGYKDFANRFTPILNEYEKLGVRFALE
ncbi:MAG TPA: TIM barrel protein, partial [Dysgonamonadaceae bacterium]|nr:TIM barrel protein [Dysgonamonadaceae bacterium]